MRKILITILVLLIVGSIGVIGYFVYNQNSRIVQTITKITKIPAPIFPVASTTIIGGLTNDGQQITATSTSQPLGVPNRPELSQMSIVSLAVVPVGKILKTVFIEKGTGNLYSLDDQNNMTRLSNTTLPGVGEAYLGYDAKGLRSIIEQEKNGQINTSLGSLKILTSSSTEPGELKITSWVNHLSFAISPSGDKAIYLEKQKDDSANVYISDWQLKSPKKIWSSPLTDWVIAWPKDNIITITSRASFDYPGLVYLLNLTTGQSKKILSDINGLTTKTSPNNQKIIYSKSLLGGVSLYQYETATGTNHLLDINTLPDKCVWFDDTVLYCAVPKSLPSGQYPDDWYQGKIVFADDIWRLDLKQKTNTLVYSLKGNYDLDSLVINKQTGWLYAINRGDNTLQAFSLKP